MEFLLLLLLPLLGSVLGDHADEDDDPPPDDAGSPKQTTAHDGEEPDGEDDSDTEAEDHSSLPGGDTEEDAPVAEVATVADCDGSTETLILQVDKDLLGHTTGADLTAETDAESGDITLALAGQEIALLTAPRGFDLAKVALETA